MIVLDDWQPNDTKRKRRLETFINRKLILSMSYIKVEI